jgi:hypothetical protein
MRDGIGSRPLRVCVWTRSARLIIIDIAGAILIIPIRSLDPWAPAVRERVVAGHVSSQPRTEREKRKEKKITCTYTHAHEYTCRPNPCQSINQSIV